MSHSSSHGIRTSSKRISCFTFSSNVSTSFPSPCLNAFVSFVPAARIAISAHAAKATCLSDLYTSIQTSTEMFRIVLACSLPSLASSMHSYSERGLSESSSAAAGARPLAAAAGTRAPSTSSSSVAASRVARMRLFLAGGG